MAKERAQSKEMQERLENIERVKEQLAAEGYQSTDKTFSALTANLMMFATGIPISVLLFILYYLMHRERFLALFECRWWLFFLVIGLSVPVHEFLHGVGFVRACREKWKSVGFGFHLTSLMPYCYCREALSIGSYLFAVLLPCTVLGVIPSVIGLAAEIPMLFLFGIYGIVIASGDLTIVLFLLRYIGRDVRIFDHPSKCGSIVFHK